METMRVWVVEFSIGGERKVARLLTGREFEAKDSAAYLQTEMGWDTRVRPATLTFDAGTEGGK